MVAEYGITLDGVRLPLALLRPWRDVFPIASGNPEDSSRGEPDRGVRG
jgi:hypothetical protein